MAPLSPLLPGRVSPLKYPGNLSKVWLRKTAYKKGKKVLFRWEALWDGHFKGINHARDRIKYVLRLADGHKDNTETSAKRVACPLRFVYLFLLV